MITTPLIDSLDADRIEELHTHGVQVVPIGRSGNGRGTVGDRLSIIDKPPIHTTFTVMRLARKNQFDPQQPPWLHCVSRCVRKAFLCGDGTVMER